METHTWRYAAGCPFVLETKYRDIADGNLHPANAGIGQGRALETRYRDIADGNLHDEVLGCVADEVCWEPRGFLARMQTRNPITTYPRPNMRFAEIEERTQLLG